MDKIIVTFTGILGIFFTFWYFLMKEVEIDLEKVKEEILIDTIKKTGYQAEIAG